MATLAQQRKTELEAAARAAAAERTARTPAAEANADRVHDADLAQARALGGQIRAAATAANTPPASTPSGNTNTNTTTPTSDTATGASVGYSTIESALTTWGLGDLVGQAQGWLQSGVDSATIVNNIRASDTYKTRFAGIVQAENNGFTPPTEQQYLDYENTAKALASTAGLPAGFMSSSEIATLIGNNVSATELTARVNDGYVKAMQADPTTRGNLGNYFGINTGDLAGYYLDPTKASANFAQQLQAAQIGAEGINSGFGDIGGSSAMNLASLGITTDAARSGFSTISKLLPLTSALPGETGAPITSDDLLNAQFLGSGQAQLAIQHATEARTAPSRGGGGFAAGAQGVSGVGSAQQ